MRRILAAGVLALLGLALPAAAQNTSVTGTRIRTDDGAATPAIRCVWSAASGTPEGAVTGNVCDLFTRTDGAAGTILYVKTTGTGNTGWVAYASGGTHPVDLASDVTGVLPFGNFPTGGTWTLASDLTLSGSANVVFSGMNVGIGATPAYEFHVRTGSDENFQVRSSAIPSGGVLFNAANNADAVNVPMQFGASLYNFANGPVFLNDTANANCTICLTINQSTNDDQAFALKSSPDISHGITTLPLIDGLTVEDDDYFAIAKRGTTGGGVAMVALAEEAEAIAFYIEALAGTPDTSHATTTVGMLHFVATEHDGSNALTAATGDGALFVIAANTSGGNLSRFVLQTEGELHITNTTLVALDAHEDAMAVRGLQLLHSGGRGLLPTIYDGRAYNYQRLHAIGVVGERDDQGQSLVSVQKYFNLHDGAIWQNYIGGQETRQIVGDLEVAFEAKLQAVRMNLAILKGQFDEITTPRLVAAAGRN